MLVDHRDGTDFLLEWFPEPLETPTSTAPLDPPLQPDMLALLTTQDDA